WAPLRAGLFSTRPARFTCRSIGNRRGGFPCGNLGRIRIPNALLNVPLCRKTCAFNAPGTPVISDPRPDPPLSFRSLTRPPRRHPHEPAIPSPRSTAPSRPTPYDAIIVGGGPAGLNAALVLGRCRRRVLVIDAGRPRNAPSQHLHNFLSRDGVNPLALRRLGRAELRRYGVTYRAGLVSGASCVKAGFVVRIEDGPTLRARALLLATGVADALPDISNVRDFYGRGVHHCPYCDAWEYRDKPIAAYGRARRGLGLALSLLTWTPDVTVVTGGGRLSADAREEAARFGVGVRTEKIIRLEGKPGRPSAKAGLARVIFEQGPPLRVSALFFNTFQLQRSTLPVRLGCRIDDQGSVIHDRRQRTGVPGLYLAGDASYDVQFAIVAGGVAGEVEAGN